MGDFSEKIKTMVKEKAHFRCCRCHRPSVQVHHIIPQEHGGSDDIDNAAPLCPNCHADFGDNPKKRKEIRQMRDWWYKACDEMYKTVVVLKEKPEPRTVARDFPIVLFYHKEEGNLHLTWPNEFLHYYLFASSALTQLAKTSPRVYKKAVSNHDYRLHVIIDLIEWLILSWLSRDYHHSWLMERKRYEFPWATEITASPIETPGIGVEKMDFRDNVDFGKNTFFAVAREINVPLLTQFAVPSGTIVSIERDGQSLRTSIILKNEFYMIRFGVSFRTFQYRMSLPKWLSGLDKNQQEKFATIACQLSFQGEPNPEKLTSDKMSFYQKWAEDLCQGFQDNFDWLAALSRIKDRQIFEIRKILDQ